MEAYKYPQKRVLLKTAVPEFGLLEVTKRGNKKSSAHMPENDEQVSAALNSLLGSFSKSCSDIFDGLISPNGALSLFLSLSDSLEGKGRLSDMRLMPFYIAI